VLRKITDDMKLAMKSKDKLRLNTIRMFRSSLKYKEIELKTPLTDANIIGVAASLIKQRRDSAKQYITAGRQDLADKELGEVDILNAYMPKPLDEQAVRQAIADAICQTGAIGMRDMGKVMALLKNQLQGKTDMAAVSASVKDLLQA